MTEPEQADPKAISIDILGDWYQTLIDARAGLEKFGAEEKEAKTQIGELLAKTGAKIGLVGGVPAVQISTRPGAWPPALSKLDEVARVVGERNAELVARFLSDLGVEIPVDRLTSILGTSARAVLTSYTKVGQVTTIETKRFLPKN